MTTICFIVAELSSQKSSTAGSGWYSCSAGQLKRLQGGARKRTHVNLPKDKAKRRHLVEIYFDMSTAHAAFRKTPYVQDKVLCRDDLAVGGRDDFRKVCAALRIARLPTYARAVQQGNAGVRRNREKTSQHRYHREQPFWRTGMSALGLARSLGECPAALAAHER